MRLHYERALLLFQQSRYDLAEGELTQALAADPDDAACHALRALCLNRRNKHRDATEAAQRAIALNPGLPMGHYALAEALLGRDCFAEAEEAVAAAIECNPGDPKQFSLLGLIRFNRRDWAGALAATDQGLRLDPEHSGCVNVRAMALVKLGRRSEASATIRGALARDPEDAFSHANEGWNALHASDPRKALEHFRESLRLNPELDWARAGMVEALKARHLVYRLMLRFFLWMGRLGFQVQFAVVIGVFVVQRSLVALARDNPQLAPVILPVLIVLIVFVVLTWTADPLFNLLLRLNRFGRYALSREQVLASNWVGLVLLGALVSLTWGLLAAADVWLVAALLLGFLMMTVAGVFKVAAGWPRGLAAAGALALVATAATGIGLWIAAEQQRDEKLEDLAMDCVIGYFWGTVAFSWAVNFLILARPKH